MKSQNVFTEQQNVRRKIISEKIKRVLAKNGIFQINFLANFLDNVGVRILRGQLKFKNREKWNFIFENLDSSGLERQPAKKLRLGREISELETGDSKLLCENCRKRNCGTLNLSEFNRIAQRQNIFGRQTTTEEKNGERD